MDAKGAAKMVRLIRNQEPMTCRPIAHGVLMTRTNAAMV
jgi:chromosome partitioning protein